MNLDNFRFETDADGIALVTWDMPGRSMNVMTPEVIAEIGDDRRQDCDRRFNQGRGRHLRQGGFSGGADLTFLKAAGDEYARLAKTQGEEAAMRAFVERTKQLNIDLSGGSRPAASRSPRRSTAYAWAAASSWRSPATIASSPNDKTRVGLPEIKVGLFPGGGGTQRVARLMPTPDALQMLLKGDQIRPAAAKKMGLVHEVAPADQIVALAKAWVKANPNAKAPWDDPKFKAPSGKVFSAQGMMIWPPANAIYRRETYDNYPAAEAILTSRVRGPAIADGSGAGGREQAFRQHPPLQGSQGDDPLAVPVDGRAQQGRAPSGQRSGDELAARLACSAQASWARASPMSRPAPGSRSC